MTPTDLIREAARSRIINKALLMSEQVGYQWITRDDVARSAGVSTGYVSQLFGSFVELKRAVVREAVRVENLVIIRQALVDGNKDAMAAPDDLKRRALASLL